MIGVGLKPHARKDEASHEENKGQRGNEVMKSPGREMEVVKTREGGYPTTQTKCQKKSRNAKKSGKKHE